ncbi:MarR family winged helix-turn-helix transcriptional regulator [Streptomyces hokutonensis]|uniref:MarR family winged helix-turn-helix transcriptional regulator n=1 Tax=Streptomyces hokutonensis TaxID=1306990 RepID=UPI000687B1FC|nr:MarR family winged helix-turn-helix transcriptional regulator [Streptomyces hokutonensis]
MARSPGAELALLLLGGFQAMVDDVHGELAHRGHPGVRAGHEFALRAIDGGADTASELGRRLSVSKQGAAKTITSLEKLGYVEREPDPVDGRLKRLRVTDRGHDMMTLGASLFDDVRERWAAQMGPGQLEALEGHLARFAASRLSGVEPAARLVDDFQPGSSSGPGTGW